VEIKVVPATQELIDRMKGNIRKADHEEGLASHGIGAVCGIQISFNLSDSCWIVLLNNEPAFAFGVGKESIFSKKAIVWLLGTPLMDKMKVSILRGFKPYIKAMFEGVSLIENYVDERNKVSKKWLKFMGFKLDEPNPYGIKGLPFRRFYMNKEDLCVYHS